MNVNMLPHMIPDYEKTLSPPPKSHPDNLGCMYAAARRVHGDIACLARS